jgi:hypothetical protein
MSQRDRDSRRPRVVFPATAWEALEGRQLLSTATASHAAEVAAQKAAAAQAKWNAYVEKHDAQLAQQALVKGLAISTTPAAAPSSGMTIPENNTTITGQQFKPLPASGTIPSPDYTTSIVSSPGVVASSSTKVTSSTTTTTTSTSTTTPAAQTLGAPTPAGSGSTTTTTTTVTQASASQPFMFLTEGSLTTAQGNALRTAINNLASAYTYGKTPATDQAAVAAFEVQVDNVAQPIWAASHVASPSSVTNLQQAINTFASAYTNGTNPATDASAWASLESALRTFYGSLPNPNALAAAPSVGDDLLAALFQGKALTTTEMNSLRNAFTVFLTTDTYGQNKTTDAAAVSTFRAALGTLESTHLQNNPPSTWTLLWTATPAPISASRAPVSAASTTAKS